MTIQGAPLAVSDLTGVAFGAHDYTTRQAGARYEIEASKNSIPFARHMPILHCELNKIGKILPANCLGIFALL
jgi:hypothetical protein